jgi:methylmalonyl-CoA mutase N-terminal domain/subunit
MASGEDQPGPTGFQTPSGIQLDPVYRAPDQGCDYEDHIGDPGSPPYTRGIHPGMYRDRLWTMRQYAGFGSAAETNRRFKYLLKNGQTGLSVAFDLPTQMGMDSDHRLALGEVGRVGVAIDTLADIETLFEGIPLDRVSTSMTINATAPILLALYLVAGRKRGVALRDLRGTVQNDILKEYIARGTYIYPPAPSLRLVTDVIEYCQSEVPRWNPISISGYHIREAGSTAVQELAFTLGNAIAYVESALARGLEIDDFAPRLSFFFNVHNELLEEVAKFRAARRLWTWIAKDRFGAREAASMALRFHAQTAGSALTAQSPDSNIVRVALQAVAAVLGGAQSLHTNAMDEALALPTEESARLALRTQQVVAYESGLANTADPVGGSYAIEALTDRIEDEVRAYLERVDGLGGMGPAIEAGFVQAEIQESAYRQQRALETGERITVGVNRYVAEVKGPGVPTHKVDVEAEPAQVQRLRAVREQRDPTRVQATLDALEAAARGGANLMPAIVAAVDAYASVGEISDRLREVFGEYTEAAT